jgi:hypothetical protein
MISLENQTRAEMVMAISRGILKTIHGECTAHGPDPQTHAMIVAALSMAIDDLDKAFPGTKKWMQEMLKERT